MRKIDIHRDHDRNVLIGLLEISETPYELRRNSIIINKEVRLYFDEKGDIYRVTEYDKYGRSIKSYYADPESEIRLPDLVGEEL